tara:strand:- start:98 stop:844 length:747 start_codon:yes stop_codon:yes gene_type:complete
VGILGDSELVHDWENVAEWLQLAAAIKNVEVDIIQFQQGFGYCSAADEYSMAREELLNSFVLALSRFNFVWGGLESCLNNIKPPKHPDKSKRGKIGNACYYLKQYYSTNTPVLFLGEAVESFRLRASECIGYESVDKRFKRSSDVGWPGSGLFTVYELRNLFAHGSLSFPEPDEENQPISDHHDMVVNATRVVLLSIQMLLLAHFEHSELEIPYSYNIDLDSDDVALWVALSGCHLYEKDAGLQNALF